VAGLPSAASADQACALFSAGVETRFGARTDVPTSHRIAARATVAA
jgi:hypothetical protein